MLRRISPLILILLLAATALSAKAKPKKAVLLRDGYTLNGVDGKIDARGPNWLFTAEHSISDGKKTIKANSKFQLLPSTGLDKLITEMSETNAKNYRLYNTIVTKYKGRNYLFLDYYLPLADGKKQETKTADANETEPAIQINEPNDVIKIPEEILEKLKTRRIVRPEALKGGTEFKQDSILTGRTGIIRKKPDGQWTFAFDAIGRNASEVSLDLLPCEALERAQVKAARRRGRIRFSVSGIVTKYKGKYYMLLQSAKQVYNYGNFGR